MSKKKIPGIVAFIILTVPTLLALTGCPQHIDSLYGLKVTGDGTGGAIVLYEDELGGNIYAQKISPDGKPVWGGKGTLLGGSGNEAYSFFNLNIVSDGSGGAIAAWPDFSLDPYYPTNHLARIDDRGEVLWQHDFIYFNQMISDGFGGAIIAFDYPVGVDNTGDGREDLTLVAINSQGDYSWGLQRVSVPRQNYLDGTLQMASDGSGGVIIVWEELQYPPEAKPEETISTGRIFAQKISSKGELEWGDGVPVYTTPENTYAETPGIISDGSGGAILVWQQMFSGRIEDGSPEARMMDIFVQKLDAGGNTLWQENGLPLDINKNAGNAFPTGPLTASDGSGGAIIIWRDSRDKTGIYGQEVDASGAISWQAGGVKVSSTSLNPRPQMVSSGAGEALISYSFQEDWKMLHAQKLDSKGQSLWQDNGIPVVEDGFAGYSTSPDRQGGLIVAWGVGKGIFGSEEAYVQRVSADGKLMWGETGIRLNP